MRIGPSRRLFLQSLCAGLVVRPAQAHAQDLPRLSQLARIATGNTRLNPLAMAGADVAFCGDSTVGLVSTGQNGLLWSDPHGFDTPAEFRPRLAGGFLICGGRRWLAAYDLGSGAEVWRYTAEIQAGVPHVSDGLVIFGDGHQITALDSATGSLRWRFATVVDTLVSYAPTVHGDTAYIGPGDGQLYALSLADGSLRWQVDGGESWQYLRQIQVEGDVLVAGTYKEILTGLSLQDGSSLWSFNAGNFINSQHVADGSAYLWSPTGWIYCIATDSGRVRWRHLTTDYNESSGNWASVLAELQSRDSRLYVLDLEDVLHVVDTATGNQHQAAVVPGRIRHAVLPLDGALAFPTAEGEVLLTADL